jgi:predicted phage-related endonuclease
MSDPLLSKMDALLKKHRGGGIAKPEPLPRHAPPPGAWLPVLTDVIERGTPPVAKASAAAAPAAAQAAPTEAPSTAAVPAPAEDDALAEQLLCELAPRLSEAMEKQVSEELRRKLDQTVEGILSQLDVDVRNVVRDAVAEKLKAPRDPST